MVEPTVSTLQRHRWALPAIVALVVLGHALVTAGVAQHMKGALGLATDSIERMEATFVADMQLTEPPVVVAPPATAALPVAEADVATEAASKPAPRKKPKEKEKKPEATRPPLAASAPTDMAVLPSTETVASVAPGAEYINDDPSTPRSANAEVDDDPTPKGPAFAWPKATRVTYKVQGYLRGEIHGSAKVEWIRQDMRYQVHVDALVGPSFAPLGSQRWTSEGVITDEGLAPERFESINKLLIKTSPAKVVTFDEAEVTLPNGDRVPKLPGVQDPASHYIQLAYQFILKPEQLRVGATIEMPMAWTKRQEVVIYDVLSEEALDTPLGKIDTFKLKPRKMTEQKGDVLAEIWLAPGLQYLPIRMLFRQGPETYLEMHMDKAPQQVAADAPDEPARGP
jgi:hypothetical protein